MFRTILPALLATAALAIASTAAAQSRDVPPTDGAALLKWLQAGRYKAWTHESTAHPSLGPHPSAVITFLNPTLDRSLAAKNAAHPKGAAAVKELLNMHGKLAGWAVSVKTADDSAGGKGWYWFEILGTRDLDNAVANANGVPLCYGCHTPGRDFVLIQHPLR